MSLTIYPFIIADSSPQKEPKLSRARQIPEWSEYDAEIAKFARRLAESNKISSSALGEEADNLAAKQSGKAAPAAEEPKAPEAEESKAPEVGHDEL